MYVSENICLGKVNLKIKWPGRLEKHKFSRKPTSLNDCTTRSIGLHRACLKSCSEMSGYGKHLL
jgi:hypothetical protein